MKPSIISYVGWLLVVAAAGFYLFGVYHAVQLSWPPEPGKNDLVYNPVLATAMGTIQALLLANMGALLGFSMAAPNSAVARSLRLGTPPQGANMAPPPPMEQRERIQLVCLLLFVLSLIACVITWQVNDWSESAKQVVPFIPESGKLFIGVVIAYATAVLK